MKSLNESIIEYKKQLDRDADSIVEYTITDNPDFNDPEALTRQI